MEEKFRKFMVGRYGIDGLSMFLTYFALILMLVLSLSGNADRNWIPMVIIIGSYARVFSKNRMQRMKENQKFQELVAPFTRFFNKWFHRIFGSKSHLYFNCPNCKTELKVPRGKGKVRITCPKCAEKFEKDTGRPKK